MPARLNQTRGAASGGDDLELLSCLIDGELSDEVGAQMLDRICADPQACRRWTLLHAAGDALRSSEVGALHSSPFVERVRAALASEPSILAPVALRRRYQRVVLPGMAVAAAAALLVVVAVPQMRSTDATSQAAATPAVAPAQGAPQPIEVTRVPELERYLRAHRELAGGSVMPATTPYLRTSNNLPAEAR